MNALCHRQYERYNLTIGIALYDDRIEMEMENPGILPPQITPENIREPHISYPYNPLIANVLYSTTYIENWGSGVKRIIEACQKRGVAAPTWSINGGFVVVTFVRPTNGDTQDDTQGVTKDVTKQLSDRQKFILQLIENDAFVTTNEMSQKTGVTTRTIKRDLEYLQEQRILAREGGRKEGRWIIMID